MTYEKDLRVDGKHDFKIKDWATAPNESVDEGKIKDQIAKDIKQLAKYQDQLYAQKTKGVLIVFQAMDAAGKDSMIKHVMSGVNPEGTSVSSFKQPTSVDLSHDYLWRIHLETPERGNIKIFNRSHYEDVLISRVHPEILTTESIPGIQDPKDVTPAFFEQRYRHITEFEQYLADTGFVVLKFFLHLSKDEQKNRFMRRLEIPEKNWKFSEADVKERQFWPDYQKAYEEAIQHTATEVNPWYVIPADNKWYSRLLVSEIINERLKAMDLAYPTVTDDRKAEFKRILTMLQNEK